MKNDPHLHHIQKSIILSLANKSPLRFSELQPPRIPNNTFSYHLKKLLQAGYIESTEDGYTVTRKALKLIAFSANREKAFSSPLMLSMLFITNDEGEVLLLNRNNRPFQGWYGLPSGIIHLGETVQQAAKRELKEKTNITATHDLQAIGALDFRYTQQESDDIFVHAVAFAFSYNFKGDKTILADAVTKYGQLSWSKFGRSHILPEVYAIKEMLDAGSYMHVSKNFTEPTAMPVFVAA